MDTQTSQREDNSSLRLWATDQRGHLIESTVPSARVPSLRLGSPSAAAPPPIPWRRCSASRPSLQPWQFPATISSSPLSASPLQPRLRSLDASPPPSPATSRSHASRNRWTPSPSPSNTFRCFVDSSSSGGVDCSCSVDLWLHQSGYYALLVYQTKIVSSSVRLV